MHLVTLATPDGQVAKRTTITPGQKKILDPLIEPDVQFPERAPTKMHIRPFQLGRLVGA